MRIHLTCAMFVVVAGVYWQIEKMEWIVVSACIVLVMVCEILNTAIEKLCDVVHPERHSVIGYVKDISAGAVLLACIFAVIAGTIVFLPKIID
jgi:undecaprenol kinase